jgi:hypothetical protein
MRYARGGGLTAEGRRRRELVRLAAAERFEHGIPVDRHLLAVFAPADRIGLDGNQHAPAP